jgi:molybdopterin-guanine dinucleotide biosynthesis protein A
MRNAPDARRLRSIQIHTANRSALIFAGGRATRLGGVNKALLEIGQSTILSRILGALRPLVAECVVLTNDATLERVPEVRLVFDPEPHAGVLPALAAGLEAAHSELCLAVACDMPFVSRAVFEQLLNLQALENADVVIPRAGEYLEPMHAVYRRHEVLSAIRAALARGEQRMISYLAAVRVVEVAEPDWRVWDPTGRAFFNVNTPADLQEAQRLAAQP